jgi:ElaB/YqjD/DUF883 family membrane-anchored ribosome-binding protein
VEDEPELIRDQMQETRTALTEKLEALEQKVTGTVDSTASAVAETVQNLTDTVQETVGTVKETVASTVDTVSETVESTVETVKDTFDIPGHVQRHPWIAMAGSVATGFLLGRMLHSGESSSSSTRGGTETYGGGGGWFGTGPSWPDAMRQSSAPSASSTEYRDQPTNGRREEESERKSTGVHEGIAGTFLNAMGGEVDKLKGLGVAAVFGVLRDLVTRSVPGELGSRLKEWVNGLTEKMGAKPLTQPLVSTEEESQHEDGGNQSKGREETSSSSPQQQQPDQPAAKGAPSQRGGSSSTGSAPRR